MPEQEQEWLGRLLATVIWILVIGYAISKALEKLFKEMGTPRY